VSEVRVKRDALVEGGAIHVDGGPFGICLVRLGDAVYALADRCSHANYALSEGDVDARQGTVECWRHGSTFSLRDGVPQCLPAIKPVDVYPVTVEDDVVVVEVP
jgi:3-phenylpropionate/trans-cinnamate dioxygenase ferredoxin subunit